MSRILKNESNTLKISRTDPRKTRANEEKVNVEKHEEFQENKLEIAKTQQKQPEDLPQRPEKANHDDNFHKLLDESKNIQADVHEALLSCSWLSRKYGIARPNKKMPFLHLYVTSTIDFEKENSEAAIKNEIDEKLKWKASQYIELRSKPLKEAKFRML
ncbi:uncharacterized protein LOC124438476 [Xenia sp. Carnegie-2017]|uniref:uncharacterized protein LOC124438476 n=1 Tax=Xenia sp. Carnegie-2017 TaxID=2897299 RepID=UPI001F04F5A7|nr:uncharacterized protein LOC124438476 [Xenia sp. Carnegie-2017]